MAARSVSVSYPEPARRLNKEATVRVRVLVDERGRAVRAEVAGEKAGFGFDEAARVAALRAVYKPGTVDGVPQQMETFVNVRFKLDRD